jgi:hypothetical protein
MYELSSRRVVLKMLAGAVPVMACRRDAAPDPVSLLPVFKNRFADRHSLHAAAEAYFALYPGEFGLTRLCILLLDGIGSCPADRLPDRLKQSAVRDFAAGDVVLVGGWVLARTEARLLAAASLVPPGV